MESVDEKTFRRKLDIYYLALLIYVLTGAIYIVVSGSFIGDKFAFVVRDPVVYLFGVFIIYSGGLLLVNVISNRRLVITPQQLVFRSRFGERSYYFSHIERIVLKRERPRVSNIIFNVVKLRTSKRRRWIRIRVANYEREQELYQEFKAIKLRLKK